MSHELARRIAWPEFLGARAAADVHQALRSEDAWNRLLREAPLPLVLQIRRVLAEATLTAAMAQDVSSTLGRAFTLHLAPLRHSPPVRTT
jgi:hypothetical protein